MKKNWIKAVASLTLVASLLVPQMASADTGKVTVKVRLFAPHGLIKEKYIQVGAGSFTNSQGETVKLDKPTALGALIELLNEEHISYSAKTESFGSYVTKIGDVEQKSINTNTGYSDWVNNASPQVGADQTEIKDGDEIVWAFSDFTQTLYPNVQVESNRLKVGSALKFKVTAQKTTYDANWVATTKTVPVVGATVTVTTEDGTQATLGTDDKGEASVNVDLPGLVSYYVDQVDKDGLPLVVRSDTNYVLMATQGLKFSDMKGYSWASSAVTALADRGVVVGDGASHFEPGRAVTRGELSKMIALNGDLNLGGIATFADVNSSNPFYTDIQTVARKGIMSGDGDTNTFRPAAGITRQELATVLVRLAGLQPSTDKSELKFGDRAAVKPYAESYVKTAVAHGLMVGDDQGNFRPQATATRAEVAKALVNVMNHDMTK
ncbi:MAG: S-layer homology domain-containing protein [Tumebacillaceae bacterium]